MLVLERRLDESIVINPGSPGEIVVTVIEIRGDKVRLGLAASAEVVIHRSEVVDRIDREAAARKARA